jgi:hypothetical protein
MSGDLSISVISPSEQLRALLPGIPRLRLFLGNLSHYSMELTTQQKRRRRQCEKHGKCIEWQIVEEKIRKLAAPAHYRRLLDCINASPIMIDECDYSPSDV